MFYSLSEIQKEFLKYAPAYAQKEAAEALQKVAELQSQGIIRNGLYYIVLVDLVGSTKYGAEHGNEKLKERIQFFVTSSFNALNEATLKNVALFVKEIGDAVLYIFQHFPDILLWSAIFNKWLAMNKRDTPFEIRTCVNIGEVSLQGVNPLSLAISQTFKMEKSVLPGQLVLTEATYIVAWPTVARAYHGFSQTKNIELDGFQKPVPLYKLHVQDENDLERIPKEKLF